MSINTTTGGTAVHHAPLGNPVDLVSVELFSKSLENIADEMGTVMVRSSGSPVIAEAADYATCILDAQGEVIAYGGNMTGYVGMTVAAVRHVLATTDVDQLSPGDMFICNDPFTTGNAHQVDVSVLRPIFAGTRLMAWTWVLAHVADFGGFAPGGMAPMATETYGEALRLPGVKLVSRGKMIDDVWRIISTNIRVPELVLNDIRCFIAACNRGDDRLQNVLATYGSEDFVRYSESAKELTERAARARIALLPDGVYEAEDYVEHNGHTDALYRVHCTLTVAGENLTFDFTATDPQSDGFVNCSAAVTTGFATNVVLSSLLSDLPLNHGVLRSVRVVTKPGTLCDVRMPAPCSAGHFETGTRVVKVATRLLARVQSGSADDFVRLHAMASFQESWNGGIFYGPDDTGNLVPFFDMNGGGTGGGGQAVTDGLDAAGLSVQPLNSLPDIEINEQAYPVLYLWRTLTKNSGGPGRYRGGHGVEVAWTPWHTSGGTQHVWVACWQVPPDGAFGGYPGSTSGFSLVSGARAEEALAGGRIPSALDEFDGTVEPLHAKHFGSVLHEGDVLHLRCGGGAGYGDPIDRDIAAVESDVRAGTVTAAAAGEVYGVELAPDGTADPVLTERRRAAIRGDRMSWERVGPHSVRRTSAAARLSEMGQWCRARDNIDLLEFADPATGELLRTEVRVESE
ncbi:MAG TPA: hydantoinase B/oxoprolinase family protein [Mycobacterium sp.]|jgi:N-methylhydantoinase B|nr:hydantoinase B/oxoprolinase family protein [Mycobacterium sp.]